MLSSLSQIKARLTSSVSLRARFSRGMMFSLVAAVFNSGSTLLVNIVVANLLGRQVFGEYAIVQNTLLTLSTVASLANGFTTTKYVAEFRSTNVAKAGRIIGLTSAISLVSGAVSTIGLVVGAHWLAGTILNAPNLSVGLLLSAVAVFFNVSNYFQVGVLTGLESYPAIAWAGVLAGSSYTLACLGGAYLWGLNGALAGIALSAGIQWWVLSRFVKRESLKQGLIIDYRGMFQEFDVFIHFALPAALSGFSTMPALWLANAFLARQPDGYSQAAVYAAANNMRVLGLFLPGLINNVGLSILNNIKGLGERKSYIKAFWGNFMATFGMAVLGGAFIILVGQPLLSLFGRSFRTGYDVLVILIVAMLVEAMMLAAYQIIQSREKIWISFFLIAVPRDWTIALLAFWLTPHYGAIGLAYAYLAGCFLALICASLAALKLSGGVLSSAPVPA